MRIARFFDAETVRMAATAAIVAVALASSLWFFVRYWFNTGE